jgi:DNA-directed RNA polymerase II subunit RPB1
MTLNTFHLAGVAAKSGMTRGVPRLKELLKVTQNPKATSLTIYMRPDLIKSKEDARRLTQELEFTMLKDLVTVARIYYDPRDSASLIAEDTEWLTFFTAFEQNLPEEPSPWILRLELDRERMFNKNITIEDINFVLRKQFEGSLETTYSDHNATRIVLRIRMKFKQDPLDDLVSIKAMQNKVLTSVLIRGLPGLKSVSFRMIKNEVFEKDPAQGKYESLDQFVLDTLGTNFLDVIIHPDVDGLRLISNHVHDINDNLGIEAARAILFREIFGLFEQAAPVNYRHVALLVDSICNRGRLMSADRIGVNKKVKIGHLAKASFEQAEDIMLRAAIFGEMDPVTSVSANIMTGQPIRAGTSFSHILLDESAMANMIATSPAPKKTLERVGSLQAKEEEEEVKEGCRIRDLQIPAPLPTMVASEQADAPELEMNFIDEE